MAKQSVAKKEQMPAYMNKGPARGSENVGTDDIILPRVDVLQALSPQIKKSDPKYIEGAEQGGLFNTLTGELYDGSVFILPVYFQVRYVIWKDRDAGGGMRGMYDSQGEGDAFIATQEDASLLECVKTGEHICLLLDKDYNFVTEVMIPMSRSKMKVSRKLNSLVKLNGGDRFSRVYEIAPVEDKGAKGEYWNFGITNAAKPWPAEELYSYAEGLYDSISSGKASVSADYSDEESEGAGSPTEEDI